jgi:hypothetical protein
MGHISRFSDDKWIPTNSGYTRGQCWNMLNHAWIGFKRSRNAKNGESFQDQLKWARLIQDVQTALGLQRSSFLTLGLLGDVLFLYDKQKELEHVDLECDIKIEKWKKEKKAYTREIVQVSMLSEQEIEWLKEDFQGAATVNINGFLERIIMPNAFDMIYRKL